MLYFGIDPGGTIGMALYDSTAQRVLFALETTEPAAAKAALFEQGIGHGRARLAIEGVGLYRTDPSRPGSGIVGESVFATARQVGWFSALFGLPPTGPHILGNAQVRGHLVGFLPSKSRTEAAMNQRLRDMHGGEDSTKGATEAVEATFRKDGSPWRLGKAGRAAGALYGVKGHSWSALAVAVAMAIRDGNLDGQV